MTIARWLLAVVKRLAPSRRTASQIVAASLTTTLAAAASAQTGAPPPRPTGTPPFDTVRRYGEKFILSPSDSVVVRADTTWYPRIGRAIAAPFMSGAAPKSGSTSPAKRKADSVVTKPDPPSRPTPVRSSGGGHGSHASHASHASHRSMIGSFNGR